MWQIWQLFFINQYLATLLCTPTTPQKRPNQKRLDLYKYFQAERQGFEPWIQSPVCRISSAVHSTTLPSLQYLPVGGIGFEPMKPKQQIYSLPHLTALESSQHVCTLFFSNATANVENYFK